MFLDEMQSLYNILFKKPRPLTSWLYAFNLTDCGGTWWEEGDISQNQNDNSVFCHCAGYKKFV